MTTVVDEAPRNTNQAALPQHIESLRRLIRHRKDAAKEVTDAFKLAASETGYSRAALQFIMRLDGKDGDDRDEFTEELDQLLCALKMW